MAAAASGMFGDGKISTGESFCPFEQYLSNTLSYNSIIYLFF